MWPKTQKFPSERFSIYSKEVLWRPFTHSPRGLLLYLKIFFPRSPCNLKIHYKLTPKGGEGEKEAHIPFLLFTRRGFDYLFFADWGLSIIYSSLKEQRRYTYSLDQDFSPTPIHANTRSLLGCLFLTAIFLPQFTLILKFLYSNPPFRCLF